MSSLPEIPHWPFIPDDVLRATKYSGDKVSVVLRGALAEAVRQEAKETDRSDDAVVLETLATYLAPETWAQGYQGNSLPLEVEIKGNLAKILRKNATLQGMTPEDSALAIISHAFGFSPAAKASAKKAKVAKGLAIPVTIPGVLARHIRRQFPTSTISDSFIISLLQERLLPPPQDAPPLPGMWD